MSHFEIAFQDSFKEQKNCDVTFTCINPTSAAGISSIKAHKYVLSLVSDVFNTMFYGEAAKQEGVKADNKPIDVDDIEMPILKLLLSFIYHISVDFETADIAAEFYYAAHKYNILDALEHIKTYMLNEVSSENAVLFYEIACLYDNQELKDACLKIFAEHTVGIIDSPTFLKADPKTIEAIYKLDTLKITSEAQLVMALERYIEHNKADNSDIAEKVRPALCHIRFLALPAPLIIQTTLLNAADALAVVGCLSSEAAVSKMPAHLSLNNQKRGLLKTEKQMEIIRKLSPVFSDRYCRFCFAASRSSNHSYWNCSNHSHASAAKLNIIYEKYKHVWLMDYAEDDVTAVYEICKSLSWLS